MFREKIYQIIIVWKESLRFTHLFPSHFNNYNIPPSRELRGNYFRRKWWILIIVIINDPTEKISRLTMSLSFHFIFYRLFVCSWKTIWSIRFQARALVIFAAIDTHVKTQKEISIRKRKSINLNLNKKHTHTNIIMERTKQNIWKQILNASCSFYL